MDWNFELTEQEALALYTWYYRENKIYGRLMRALGAIAVAFAAWVAVSAVQSMTHTGFFYTEIVPGEGVIYIVATLLFLAFAILCFWSGRADVTAARGLRNIKKLGLSPLGQIRIHLDEEKLVCNRRGGQEASDPSVIQKVRQYPEGILVYLYGGARLMLLPAAIFEGPEAMQAAVAEFERCAARAKARLYEQSARQLAYPETRQELPPCPPLPKGEVQMYAVPQILRPSEVRPAYCAANRLLNPIGKGRLALLWVILIASIWEVASSIYAGDAALAVIFGAAMVLVVTVLAAFSPAGQKKAMKRQLEGEQTQRLATPGWVVLGQNGFTETSGVLCSYRPYSSLNKVAQDEAYIFLRFERNMITVVPKRGFESPEQARQAFEFLRQKLSEQKNGR